MRPWSVIVGRPHHHYLGIRSDIRIPITATITLIVVTIIAVIIIITIAVSTITIIVVPIIVMTVIIIAAVVIMSITMALLCLGINRTENNDSCDYTEETH